MNLKIIDCLTTKIDDVKILKEQEYNETYVLVLNTEINRTLQNNKRIYQKVVSSSQEVTSKSIGFLASIYKEVDNIKLISNNVRLLSELNKFKKKKNQSFKIELSIKNKSKINPQNSILYFDVENISNETKLNNFIKIYQIKDSKFLKLITSTHNEAFFKKHIKKLEKFSDDIDYKQSKSIPDGADKEIILKLIENINLSENHVLLSNDNGLIELFIDLCVQENRNFTIISTIEKYPTFIKENNLEKYTNII